MHKSIMKLALVGYQKLKDPQNAGIWSIYRPSKARDDVAIVNGWD